jgi:drug/metabolite transporter (DMT)-like permease
MGRDPAPPEALPERRATLRALLAIAQWGTLAALGLRLRHLPPFLLVGCALLLGALVGWRRLRLRGLRPRVLLLGVYGLFAYHFCLFLALRLAPPVEANLLNYLWPLLIVLLAPAIVPGARLRGRHVAGALLAFAGAALLVTGGRLGGAGGSPAGYLLALAAAVIWSTYSLLTKRLGDFPTSAIAAFCLVSGSLSLLCHAFFEPRVLPSAGDLPFLLLVGLCPMGWAFYLWDRAMKDGDPRVIGTLAYLTPLLSTLLIAASGQGSLSRASAAAAGLIVGGAALGTWPARRRTPLPAGAAPASSRPSSFPGGST